MFRFRAQSSLLLRRTAAFLPLLSSAVGYAQLVPILPPEPHTAVDTEALKEEEAADSEEGGPFSEALDLMSSDADTAMRVWKGWVERAADRNEFGRLVPLLRKKIRAAADGIISGSKLNYSAYKAARVFAPALDLCNLVDMLGTDDLQTVLAPAYGDGRKAILSPANFIKWLVLDASRPLHLLLQTHALNSGPRSGMRYSLPLFYTLWQRTPDADRTRYLNLAVACALVRKEVANMRGMIRSDSAPLLSMPEVYDFFRSMDKKHALLTDIRKISASDLMHLVSLRLPQSEIDYAQKLRYKRETWGESYSAIKYIMERATQNSDPYKIYTFEEIEKLGGVCRDQAYYSLNTARCRGIPAVFIHGDGDRGPHAWVGILTNDKAWSTSGSYGYNTGRYLNPCSGREQHESGLLSPAMHLSPEKQVQAADAMLLATYLSRIGCRQQALSVARYITVSFPMLTAAWRTMVDVMDNCSAPLVTTKEWRALYSKLMAKQAKSIKQNPELIDLAQEIQSDRLMSDKSDKQKISELKWNSKKMSKLVDAGRLDIVADAMQRQAELLAKNPNAKPLNTFFRARIKEYASQSNAMLTVLRVYKAALLLYAENLAGSVPDEKKCSGLERSAWKSAAKDAADAFAKVAFKNDGDYFAVSKDCDVMNVIADLWEAAGEVEKAEKLRDESTRRLNQAKSN